MFVTGGSSDLIRSVVNLLPKERFEVICLTRQNIQENSNGILWHVGDLLRPDSYDQILRSCNYVIHAAAVTHSMKEIEYYEVNLEGTRKLLSVVRSIKNMRFIFISSRTASEESGAYGRSKLLAEKAIQSSVGDWLILRPSEVFGGKKSEGIDKIIEKAMRGGIQLCPMGVKTPMYPIHTQDAALLIYKYAFKEQVKNETIYVNGPLPYEFSELIKTVSRVAGKSVIIFPIPKIILEITAKLLSLLNIDAGIVPDQVARLYSAKSQHAIEGKFLSVEQFVKTKRA